MDVNRFIDHYNRVMSLYYKRVEDFSLQRNFYRQYYGPVAVLKDFKWRSFYNKVSGFVVSEVDIPTKSIATLSRRNKYFFRNRYIAKLLISL